MCNCVSVNSLLLLSVCLFSLHKSEEKEGDCSLLPAFSVLFHLQCYQNIMDHTACVITVCVIIFFQTRPWAWNSHLNVSLGQQLGKWTKRELPGVFSHCIELLICVWIPEDLFLVMKEEFTSTHSDNTPCVCLCLCDCRCRVCLRQHVYVPVSVYLCVHACPCRCGCVRNMFLYECVWSSVRWPGVGLAFRLNG